MFGLLFWCILLPISVSADSYTVKIVTSQHVNLVDSRFLSFTVDPKYLFSSNDKYASKECICMASALTPAYLRIAGPSTAHMTFHNTTISINDLDFGLQNPDSSDFDTPKKFPFDWRSKKLAVSYKQWKKFVQWTKAVGFDLVFALNNQEKMRSGMWDANTALNMLTVAERANIGHIFWELGYECSNQSIEEYLNDLETLSVIIETFPPGRTGEWKVVGGDVTKCLQADSKSDFKDYITLSNDKLDALLLNGNSSSHELERMSERDRLKLLHLLSRSETPLWLTETNQRQYSGVTRAADWLASLGYAAKNGFSVHYRELEEDELYEPTLSFYMALLFKNLVGERVLDVQMDPEQAIMFAHCTSLRHKPIPGAVTLFGANIDDEPARFSLKLSKREEGGDIMQFILGLDRNGNIEVNGRVMYYEGDIKPVVKRVPPYKSLLINLPGKSFGFWVLANTKIEACHDVDTNQTVFEAETITNDRKKRSSINEFEDLTKFPDVFEFEDNDTSVTNNKAIKSRISELNKDLSKIHGLFKNNRDKTRVKREEDSYIPKKLKRQGLRYRERWDDDITPKRLIGNILEKARQSVSNIKNTIGISKSKLLNRNRLNKRHSKTSRLIKRRILNKNYGGNEIVSRKPKSIIKNGNSLQHDKRLKQDKNEISKNRKELMFEKSSETQEKIKNLPNANKMSEETPIMTESRKKRSIAKDIVEISAENHLDYDLKDKEKLWKIFKKIHKELGEEENLNDSIDSGIVLRTELSDDKATIHVQDSNHGLLKSTVQNLLNVFEDLNTSVNKLWNAVDLLD